MYPCFQWIARSVFNWCLRNPLYSQSTQDFFDPRHSTRYQLQHCTSPYSVCNYPTWAWTYHIIEPTLVLNRFWSSLGNLSTQFRSAVTRHVERQWHKRKQFAWVRSGIHVESMGSRVSIRFYWFHNTAKIQFLRTQETSYVRQSPAQISFSTWRIRSSWSGICMIFDL